ncbi:T9SS type A sorting domain-containing protein [Pseudopedobacter beijingensis]|uniref:T9SS type A sorting domain-containing protein n=1 Tax=Pseudopedobacter beijingensis TaxID=1207056 RepID=A0ABW4IGA2_9SPHI
MKSNLLKKSFLSFTLMMCTATFVSSQTRPTSLVPIKIKEEESYVQSFDEIIESTPNAGGIYPSGWGAWNVVASAVMGGTNPRVIEINIKDYDIAKLNMGGGANTTFASVYTFDKAIGFKNGNQTDYGIYTALNTEEVSNNRRVKVSFDAMVIRNLLGGDGGDLILALALQYRVGDTGNFINIGETIRNGEIQRNLGIIPASQQTFSFVLPAECSGNSIVHLRWITKYISGSYPLSSNNIPSFAIDNFMAEVVTTTPVNLKYFKGEVEANKVRLNWLTLSESNNSHFELFYSKNGKTFNFLERVEGNATTANVNTYSVYHQTPQVGANYYKLIQYDRDGTAQEKGISIVNFGLINSSKDLIIYPNPAYNEVNIKIEDLKGGLFSIQLYDVSGRKVYHQKHSLDKGNNTLRLALGGQIPAGQYFIKVDGNGSSKTGKLQVK